LGSRGLLQNPTHFLTVTRDPNGSYQQEIKDLWGRVIVRSSKHELQGNTYRAAIVSSYEYDPMGKLQREIPPKADNGAELISPTMYTYDAQSRLRRKVTPDAGLVTYAYDDMDRLAWVVDNRDRNGPGGACDTLKYAYDVFGRTVRIYKVRSTMPGKYWIKVVNVYDSPGAALQYVARDDLRALLSDPQEAPRYTRGRLVATLSYGEFCESCADSTGKSCEWKQEPIVTILSYDEAGLVERRTLGIPGLAVQKFTFTYDLQGKPLASSYTNGSRTITTEYTYDENGRLDTLIRDGRRIVASVYAPTGLLRTRLLLNGSGDAPATVAGSLDYTYMERDWLEQIKLSRGGTEVFTEALWYQQYAGMGEQDPQFNGNISRARYAGEGLGYPDIDMCYRYDQVDRLVAARNGIGRFDEALVDTFDATYAYDNAGRIARFYERPSLYNRTGPYAYGAAVHDTGAGAGVTMRSSRLAGVPGLQEEEENYLYCSNGNMVFDKSKRMAVVYDWRNLPVRFKFYTGYPEDVSPATCTALESPADGGTPYRLLAYVDMRYDAAGKRVLKQEFIP